MLLSRKKGVYFMNKQEKKIRKRMKELEHLKGNPNNPITDEEIDFIIWRWESHIGYFIWKEWD